MRIVDSLRAHSLCSPFLLIFSIASCSLLPLLSFLYNQRWQVFPILSRVPNYGYSRDLQLPETFCLANLQNLFSCMFGKRADTQSVGPRMWMKQNVFLSNPGRLSLVSSLPTSQDVPTPTGLTSNPSWPNCISKQWGGCGVFHSPPASQTGLGCDSLASATWLLWVVAVFCLHHGAPEVTDATWGTWLRASSPWSANTFQIWNSKARM